MFRPLRVVLLTISCMLPITTCAQIVGYENASPASAGVNRDRGYQMLDQIKDLLKGKYYDKTFHGIDLDARFKAAKDRIKGLSQNWQIFRVIAQLVLEFDDSHTLFVPPGRHLRVEYGFSTQMIGPICMVKDVKAGSDADKKGLKPGDAILSIGSYTPTRDNLWQIEYILYALDPQQGLDLKVKSPDGTEKAVQIVTKFQTPEEAKKEYEAKKKEQKERKEAKDKDSPVACQKFDTSAIACQLKTFEVEKKDIDEMMKQVAGSQKFILDLRGNGGGYVAIEEYLVGFFFDHDVKIGTMVSRDKPNDRIAKTNKDRVYRGDMVVLVDGDSASAAEVFARVMQIEKRAKVMGDVSSGKVMTSNFIPMANERGTGDMFTYSVFAMNVTVADLIMSDGNRLEKVGVTPDQIAVPTATAIRDRFDPVLAFAATSLGAKLSVEEASNFHFLLKKSEGKATTEDTKGDDSK